MIFALAGIVVLRVSRIRGYNHPVSALGKAQVLSYKVTPRHFPLMEGVASKVLENVEHFWKM